IESTFYTSLGSLQDSNSPLWLHFDVDVLDKAIMPAIHYPVEEGLSYKEALELFTLLRNTKKLVGISIACYHPNLDLDKKGMETLLSLLNELFKE
ncbi:MAG: arginase family protein, partial [Promethearchaeota archaeon]